MASNEQIDFGRFVSEIDRATPKLISELAQSLAKNSTSGDAGKMFDFVKFLDNGRLPPDSSPEEREFYRRTVRRMVEGGALGSGYLDLVNEWRFVRGGDGAEKTKTT